MADSAWRAVPAAAGLEDGELRGAMIGGHRLCIGRQDGRFFAMDDTCPHAGGSLSTGMIHRRVVVCPLHAWGFDIETGECGEDPSCSVRVYPMRQSHGAVSVCLDGRAAHSDEARP